MASIEFKLNLRDRPFNAIKSGTKKVEIRANKYEFEGNTVNRMRPSDIVVFRNETSNEELRCVIVKIVLYRTVRELLEHEGPERSLSSTNNLEEGIRSIESIGNYKEIIAENGVFAIEVKQTQEKLLEGVGHKSKIVNL